MVDILHSVYICYFILFSSCWHAKGICYVFHLCCFIAIYLQFSCVFLFISACFNSITSYTLLAHLVNQWNCVHRRRVSVDVGFLYNQPKYTYNKTSNQHLPRDCSLFNLNYLRNGTIVQWSLVWTSPPLFIILYEERNVSKQSNRLSEE